MFRKLAIVVGFMVLGSSMTGETNAAASVTKVRAYFVGWEVLTRSRLTAEDVVRMKNVVIEINDAGLAQNFVTWLRLGDLRARQNMEPADARLTIEVVRDDGTSERYYADKAALYSADSKNSRDVDQEFLDRFDIARK